ncbi:hypothetical protein FQN49_003764 [Arthroderma sp. PD_2]|nr:hypothetical protein FQN49_003764 [Arthroderma sp. PD_2]
MGSMASLNLFLLVLILSLAVFEKLEFSVSLKSGLDSPSRKIAPAEGSVPPGNKCLTGAEAQDLMNKWTSLAVGQSLESTSMVIGDAFQIFSESYNTYQHRSPRSGPVFTSKEAYIASLRRLTKKPILDIIAWDYGCNSITLRYTISGVGKNPETRIAGVDLVFVDEKMHTIEKAYVEFNSIEKLRTHGCDFMGVYSDPNTGPHCASGMTTIWY